MKVVSPFSIMNILFALWDFTMPKVAFQYGVAGRNRRPFTRTIGL